VRDAGVAGMVHDGHDEHAHVVTYRSTSSS